MSALRFTIKMRIRPGKADAFRDVSKQMQSLVRKNEPGAVIYEFFVATNGVDAIAHEHYSSSEDFMAHLNNVGHLFSLLSETAEFGETTISGPASEAIRSMFGANSAHPALFYEPL